MIITMAAPNPDILPTVVAGACALQKGRTGRRSNGRRSTAGARAPAPGSSSAGVAQETGTVVRRGGSGVAIRGSGSGTATHTGTLEILNVASCPAQAMSGTVLLLLQWHALVEAITVAHIMRWGCMLGRLWPRVLCAILPTEVVIPVSGDWDWTLLQTRTIYQWRQTWPVHVLKAAWMP